MKMRTFSDERVSSEKKIIITLMTLLVAVAASVFAAYYYLQNDLLSFGIFAFITIATLINYIIYKIIHNNRTAFYFFAPLPIPALVAWQITGGINGAGISYHYLYITFLFFLLGKTNGLLFVAVNLLISVSVFLLQKMSYLPTFYADDAMATYYFGYIIMTALVYIYQISKERAQEELQEQKTALQESNAKNAAILKSVGDGLVAIDRDGYIIFMNEPVHKLLGWSKEELLGKRWSEEIIIVDEKGKKLPLEKRPITQALSEKHLTTSTSYNYSYVRKNGSLLPVAITIAPILLDNTNIGVIEVFRDITKERDIDRMKTEFISLASHQLRTPLSAIKWHLEILLAGDVGKLTPEQTEIAKNVEESNERMISLVNSLLNVSRIESGRIIIDPTMTNLSELVRSVIQEVQQKLTEKKQKLILSVHHNLPLINIDQQLIRQVYINLLTNAIKYTPSGGEITIIISANEKEIISQISDTGYGIPAKDKAKVFQKFYRGDNVTKIVTDGNGLGMYLVKAIVDSSKGKIWFESHTPDEKHLPPGKQGTTFWFSLPKTGMTAKKGEVSLDS